MTVHKLPVKLTFGELRLGIAFTDNDADEFAKARRAAAKMINVLDPCLDDENTNRLRAASLAIERIEEAVMWAEQALWRYKDEAKRD